MKNFILDVRAIRRCDGGHTCNLIANGRKAAFIGPGIFDWSSHSLMVDVLDWYASLMNISKAKASVSAKGKELEADWQSSIPEYKVNVKQEAAEKKLLERVKCYLEAYEIRKRVKTELFYIDNGSTKVHSFDFPFARLKESGLYESLAKTATILSEMEESDIARLLIKLRRL